jgi:hypothetical protein
MENMDIRLTRIEHWLKVFEAAASWSFYVRIINTEDDIWDNQRQLAYVHEQPSEVLAWHRLHVDHILVLDIDPQVTRTSLFQVVTAEWARLGSWIPARKQCYWQSMVSGAQTRSILMVIITGQPWNVESSDSIQAKLIERVHWPKEYRPNHNHHRDT